MKNKFPLPLYFILPVVSTSESICRSSPSCLHVSLQFCFVYTLYQPLASVNRYSSLFSSYVSPLVLVHAIIVTSDHPPHPVYHSSVIFNISFAFLMPFTLLNSHFQSSVYRHSLLPTSIRYLHFVPAGFDHMQTCSPLSSGLFPPSPPAFCKSAKNFLSFLIQSSTVIVDINFSSAFYNPPFPSSEYVPGRINFEITATFFRNPNKNSRFDRLECQKCQIRFTLLQ